VVIGGENTSSHSESSELTTCTSSGQRNPRSFKARKAPVIIRKLEAKTAVGRGSNSSNRFVMAWADSAHQIALSD
jgi:hypothetical protein